VPLGPIVLSVVALLALGVSGALGGKLAYHYGVRVAAEADQAEGFRADLSARPPSTRTPADTALSAREGE